MKHITIFNSVAQAEACPGLYTPQVCMVEGQSGGLVFAKNSGVEGEQIKIDVDPSGKVVPIYPSDFIDLGLSVKWRNRNIGAETIYDYGNYYAWGEIETKSYYDWTDPNDSTQNYEHANRNWNKLTKYCPTDKTDYWDGEPAGTPDNKISLEMMDDVAYQTDNSWRMPTKTECEELIALPSKWMTINNVNGRVFCRANDPEVQAGNFSIMDEEGLYLYDENYPNPGSDYGTFDLDDDISPEVLQYVSSKAELNALLTEYYTHAYSYCYEGTVNVDTMLFKDEEHETPAVAGIDYQFGSFPEFNQNTMLFIPASGRKYQDQFSDDGFYYFLWSSSLWTVYPEYAWGLDTNSNHINMNYYRRYSGFTVRPVQD